MPTYDYECENGHRFEAFQSMKDDPLDECKECGGSVKRLIGPGGGFLFKGDGFYITDYRSRDYQKKAKSDAGDSSSAASEKSAKSDGQSAGKTSGAAKETGGKKSEKKDK